MQLADDKSKVQAVVYKVFVCGRVDFNSFESKGQLQIGELISFYCMSVI